MRSGTTPDEEREEPTLLETLLEGRAAPEEAGQGTRTDLNMSPHGDEVSGRATEPVEDDAPKLQRAVPRSPVDWDAKYRFYDDPAGQWRDCRISDISTAGVRLKLFDITAEEMEGRRVEVQLCGDVRHTETGMKKDVRAGIEFVDLAGDSAHFVDSLKRSDTQW